MNDIQKSSVMGTQPNNPSHSISNSVSLKANFELVLPALREVPAGLAIPVVS